MIKYYTPVMAIALFSCGGSNNESAVDPSDSVTYSMGFSKLSPTESGINFSNNIIETDSFNYFNYEYIYNGGGVAVGDINNDGLSDIYFTGNQVSDKLYLNKGDLKFEDITDKAIGSKSSEGWHTGVVMVDINNDGWLDIYVSRSGNPTNRDLLANLLFVNNGDNTFTEKAAEYGVDVKRTTTQSAFFDYDNDGDLDLYVMNHPYNSTTGEELLYKPGGLFSDILLENIDGSYKDVSAKAGILNHGFGLGIAVADLNNDGFEDVYISNDYTSPDYLYINQRNGTFKEEIKERTGHISNYSMGNDIGDINNDGLLDIIALDMVSEDHVRSKKNMGGMNTKGFWSVVNVGFHYQYMSNSLQLNLGDGQFSEIGQMAGVSKTDWSWAPLFADFDNDGFSDLFVTNGYRRDARDNDYNLKKNDKSENYNDFKSELDLMPATKIENYIFHNNGDMTFTKKINEWGIDNPVNSNGAATADFDNDGDIDLVVNNIDEASYILRNNLSSNNNYLKVKLIGSLENRLAIGATIKIKTNSGLQVKEFQMARGYQSSVEPIIHFGLGKDKIISEIEIKFYDGKIISLKNVEVNRLMTINYSDAKLNVSQDQTPTSIFSPSVKPAIDFTHKELFVNDFDREILLPHKMSQLGPFMSKGDINNDGLEDLYISGSHGSAGAMFVQDKSGNFQKISGPWEKEKLREELGSVFFDVDQDGDSDLYVVSGSNEYLYLSELMKDQLYINNGNGKFTNESKTRLPEMQTSGQRVCVGDFDNDSDLDIFIGGRQTPGFYPFAPRSYLLKNNNGFFEEVTSSSPDLMGPGMITESMFDDFDGDGDLDLICVGEWMPISFYENNDGVFSNVSAKFNLEKTNGWWMSISAGDFNGDGKNDYIVGNIGENNKFHPTLEHPLEIYCHDFDGTGSYDIVLGKYQNGTCYPVRGRQCSSEQMPFVKDKFPTYSDFAVANLSKIYGQENLEKALHYSAYTFSSAVLLSNGNSFSFNPLPKFSQMGPINKSIVLDLNQDGFLDIIGIGNNYAAEVETVRYDASCGTILMGYGDGTFKQLLPANSGFFVRGDAKDCLIINKSIFISTNNSKLLEFLIN